MEAEEKKKVVAECGGTLSLDKVRDRIRLLGAKVFATLWGQKGARQKIYDAHAAEEGSGDEEAWNLVASGGHVTEIDEEIAPATLHEEGDEDGASA